MFTASTPACGKTTEGYTRNIENVCVKVTLPKQPTKLESTAAQVYLFSVCGQYAKTCSSKL